MWKSLQPYFRWSPGQSEICTTRLPESWSSSLFRLGTESVLGPRCSPMSAFRSPRTQGLAWLTEERNIVVRGLLVKHYMGVINKSLFLLFHQTVFPRLWIKYLLPWQWLWCQPWWCDVSWVRGWWTGGGWGHKAWGDWFRLISPPQCILLERSILDCLSWPHAGNR